MRIPIFSTIITVAVIEVAGCTSGGRPQPLAIAPAAGPFVIKVIYPRSGATIASRDSSFLFGTLGRGDATLSVNGVPVEVWPNGSWLAWVPLPADTLATFVLEAEAMGRNLTDTVAYRLAQRYRPWCLICAWVDTASFTPTGSIALPPEERLRVAVRASPAAQVRLLLSGGDTVPLLLDTLPEEPPWGLRAFEAETAALVRPPAPDRYVGWVRVAQLAVTAPEDGDSAPPRRASVEVILGADTVRRPWPLDVELWPDFPPTVVYLDDDLEGVGDTDSTVNGRALPGGTYQWFFPTGTTARATGRWGGLVRLALSKGSIAWVGEGEVRRLPPGTPPPVGVVGSLRVIPLGDRVVLRIPISSRAPIQISESERSLSIRIYDVRGDIDWIQYSETNPFIRLLEWDQPVADEVVVTAHLAAPVWGYRVRWRGRELVVEIRRPPRIDRRHPLRGRTILLDAGHYSPLGARGPSGQMEPDVTLAAARLARTMLQERGARVIMTREADTAVSLDARVMMAQRGSADVLVSIHTNALPDGVNPFTNSGTSTYYFHPRSVPLARAINRAVAATFGTRDLGAGRADLALVRPSWLPAVLVEGLFQMMPEHDAWLATMDGRRRYAAAIVEGLATFLAERARPQ